MSDAEKVANLADAWAIAEWQHGFAAGLKAEKSEMEVAHKQRCAAKSEFRAALAAARPDEWNAAIEAAADTCEDCLLVEQCIVSIRSLRRAAGEEG